nr:RES family NAD+ phosphorylase [uncultured Noviherbaspirillum sp.]
MADALSAHAATYTLDLWRAVEAQHKIATMVLVDTLDEQALLESLLDQSKPPLDDALRRLHWLLFTPFRYPPLPSGSRFRGPAEPGVFYGADERRTACAELGYWRWRFLTDSPALDAIGPIPQTLFRTPVAGRGIDLRMPPFDARRGAWTAPADYAACQELARDARRENLQLIRYQSVRDPQSGACAAVLAHAAFAASQPAETESWMLVVARQHVIWRYNSVFDDAAFEFDATGWAGKPINR